MDIVENAIRLKTTNIFLPELHQLEITIDRKKKTPDGTKELLYFQQNTHNQSYLYDMNNQGDKLLYTKQINRYLLICFM